ncbi:MAG: ABC transporter substrate-binding protein, partial [Actinomycetota bacterium]
PRVRRAISHAIDRDAIARTVYGGTKTAASGYIPDGVRGFAPNACDACSLQLDNARATITSVFRGKPPAIAIDYISETSSRNVAEAVRSALASIGITASLRGHSADAYGAFLATGKQDLAQLGWLTDVPTPDGFVAEQLRSRSQNNKVGFHDLRFDSLIDRARGERDEAARLNLYRVAEQRALSLMPLIPIVFFRNRTAVASSVRGFLLSGAGTFDGSAVWLASK